MLDLRQLRDQLGRVPETQAGTRDLREKQRRRALRALQEVADEWQRVQARVQQTQPGHLVAALRSSPTMTAASSARPTPMTVVSTDGSQIYPDRHIEPTYFLLNIGRVAFQYGTTESPVLDAVPDLRFPSDLNDHFDEVLSTMTTEVVSALRDEQELAELLRLARETHVPGRPIVALADGTLIRWMLRGMQNRAVEEELIERYTGMLREFREEQFPIASYISMPGNTELVNLLRFHLDELEEEAPHPATVDEVNPGEVDEEEPPLAGLLDRHVFASVLARGERSAVFGSMSRIQRQYPEGNEICYFYLHVPVNDHESEIARVEIPAWVADDRPLVDLVHAVVMSECRKGEGYPLVLSEAHERAVIRAPERDAFQRLLGRTLRRAGLSSPHSQKRRSKQRPRV